MKPRSSNVKSPAKAPAERVVKDIRRQTRRHFSAQILLHQQTPLEYGFQGHGREGLSILREVSDDVIARGAVLSPCGTSPTRSAPTPSRWG